MNAADGRAVLILEEICLELRSHCSCQQGKKQASVCISKWMLIRKPKLCSGSPSLLSFLSQQKCCYNWLCFHFRTVYSLPFCRHWPTTCNCGCASDIDRAFVLIICRTRNLSNRTLLHWHSAYIPMRLRHHRDPRPIFLLIYCNVFCSTPF